MEGIEDVAHLLASIGLCGFLNRFRRCGCHIVPVGGKSNIIKPLAVSIKLGIPCYVVIDGDADATKPEHIVEHKRDNKSILSLMGCFENNEWPDQNLWLEGVTVWKTNITKTVEDEMGESWGRYVDEASNCYGKPGGLAKNPLAIAKLHELAHAENVVSTSLNRLAKEIVEHAERTLGLANDSSAPRKA